VEGVNEVTLVGNIGGTPERVKVSWPLLKFNLGVTEPRPTKNGKWQDKTQWFRIILKGKRVDYYQKKLRKGDQMLVKGRLSVRSYEDRKGDKKWVTEIEVTSKLLILSRGKAGREEEANAEQRQRPEERSETAQADSEGSGLHEHDDSYEEGAPGDYDDDLPF
jgi:single-strand DNA-binding protein